MTNRRTLADALISLSTGQVFIYGENRNSGIEEAINIYIRILQQDQWRENNNGITSEQLNSLPEEKWPGFLYQLDNSSPELLQFKRIKKECAVCLQELEKDEIVRELPCKHFFHKSCIDRWLKTKPSCPLDKKPVVG
ncbi:unnamed protein product [Blepharisma stoltei]|uniref:RING-type domain-containing protein n=1 Tax=Blepharisma stoltei TaxID=1481888 RepID=A0AAU9K0C7_9CILI|nr:unnamed protein product [Blepharisma stoltei]